MKNIESVFKIIGASNHCKSLREQNDYYATDPSAVEELLKLESFNHKILEPACGEGHISKVLEKNGYEVTSMDLIDRGYGTPNVNFLEYNTLWNGDIVTNPPYELAAEFLAHALDLVQDNAKVAMFLKLTFAEGQKRRKIFDINPPTNVYVATKRYECGKNGVFTGGSAVAYAWWVFVKGYKGDTKLSWFN